MKNSISKFMIFIIGCLALSNCSNDSSVQEQRKSRILAIIADDTLYVDDFIKRCEYTPRPNYCQEDGYHDKNICLNSLIAEKVFALEAGAHNPLTRQKAFQARLKGIKEQLMREQLVNDMVIEQIKIPEEEIQAAYLHSRKTVHTQAIFIPETCDATVIYRDARNGMPLDELARKYAGVSEPIKNDIKWGHIDEAAQNAIFADSVKQGTILHPTKIEGGFRMIKITGWTEEIEMSSMNRNQQMENIKKRLMDFYIKKSYQEFAQNVMKGKRLDFYPQGWHKLVNALQPLYAENTSRLPENNSKTGNMENAMQLSASEGSMPLLKIDDDVWTIQDFYDAILVHPLEISQRAITAENFQQRLRAAIASLMTDTYLTELAYQKHYDEAYTVNHTLKQWKIHYLFQYHRDEHLKKQGFTGSITKDFFDAYDNYLTPYFETLKAKYDVSIRFNIEALKKVELTRIPLMTHKTKGPYQQVVPPFPLVTNSVKANYKRM
ncbi:hypothetical protein JXJ21_02750 [candidate division KSB1 bacterium]|nr:hypothetical protein [candidate division KSB1 bacterium]